MQRTKMVVIQVHNTFNGTTMDVEIPRVPFTIRQVKRSIGGVKPAKMIITINGHIVRTRTELEKQCGRIDWEIFKQKNFRLALATKASPRKPLLPKTAPPEPAILSEYETLLFDIPCSCEFCQLDSQISF